MSKGEAVLCQVCGKPIHDVEHAATEHQEGQIYKLCCPLCLRAFQVDPLRFMGKKPGAMWERRRPHEGSDIGEASE